VHNQYLLRLFVISSSIHMFVVQGRVVLCDLPSFVGTSMDLQEARRITLTLRAIDELHHVPYTCLDGDGCGTRPIVVFDPPSSTTYPTHIDGYVRFMPWWLLREDCVRLCPNVGLNGHYTAYAAVPRLDIDQSPALLTFVLTALHAYRQPVVFTTDKSIVDIHNKDYQVWTLQPSCPFGCLCIGIVWSFTSTLILIQPPIALLQVEALVRAALCVEAHASTDPNTPCVAGTCNHGVLAAKCGPHGRQPTTLILEKDMRPIDWVANVLFSRLVIPSCVRPFFIQKFLSPLPIVIQVI
jgi:hypothetical protein